MKTKMKMKNVRNSEVKLIEFSFEGITLKIDSKMAIYTKGNRKVIIRRDEANSLYRNIASRHGRAYYYKLKAFLRTSKRYKIERRGRWHYVVDTASALTKLRDIKRSIDMGV